MTGELWMTWWIWLGAAIVLAILEVVLPGFILLGFAIGAATTGLLILAGFTATLPVILFIFAASSLAAWLVLRRLFARRPFRPKTFDHDVND